MQQAVWKVKELGAPPEGFESGKASDEKAPQIWDEWIEAVASIRMPVTWEEAQILIKCCPTEHMAGVEWALLHCIESVFLTEEIEETEETERYRTLIEQCNSDMMKQLFQLRLDEAREMHDKNA